MHSDKSALFTLFQMCLFRSRVLTYMTHLNFFEILVPVDGSYFSHLHPKMGPDDVGHDVIAIFNLLCKSMQIRFRPQITVRVHIAY